MRKLITAALVAALLFIGPERASAPEFQKPHPDAVVLCIVIVIFCGVMFVIIRGICKMCKNIPQPPPPPATNAPPVNAKTADIIMPPMGDGTTYTLQSMTPGSGWSNQLSVTLTDWSTNLCAVIRDALGNVVSSNLSAVSPYNGERYSGVDVTPYLPPQPTNALFRMVAQ